MALAPKKYLDVVAILDSSNNPVMVGAQFMRATVSDISRLMEHPIETGSVIADHIVFEPIEIDLPVMLTGPNTKALYYELHALYLAGAKLIVQSRVDQYGFMVLTEMPHEESPDVADGIVVQVRLREAVFVTATYGGLAPVQVKSKPQASTKKKGAQQTTTPAAPKAAAAQAQYKGSVLWQLAHPNG